MWGHLGRLEYFSVILMLNTWTKHKTPQFKGTVSSKKALNSDNSHKFPGPQATCTFDQLATNPGVPTIPFWFDDFLEQLVKLRDMPSLEL